jgi:uncharacterized protein (DUF2384 family)
VSNAIFVDLDIEYKDVIMSDPPEFHRRVWEVAEQLKEICRSDTSVSSLEKKYRTLSKKDDVNKEITSLLEDYYKQVDDVPLNEMPAYIDAARTLVKDLETAFKDRCVYESTRESSAVSDKRIAHAQYTRLRDVYNNWVKAIVLFNDEEDRATWEFEPSPLPPLPGNYGSGLSPLKSYVYTIGTDEYRNHRAVCKLLSIPVMNTTDFHDWLEANADIHSVIIKEVVY